MRRLIGILLVAAAFVSTAAAQGKKRVAVLDFDYATVRSAAQAWFGTDQDIGKGIADMIVERLVNGNAYRVIERKALDKILAEQNFSNSDRADPMSAAKIARILGVEAIIMGSITTFGRDDKSTGVGGGAMSHVTGRFGVGGFHHNEAKAVVAITARVINTDTAEILASRSARGESKRTSNAVGGAGGGDIVGGAGLSMTSSNFANTIIGEATTEAVAQLCDQLEQDASKLPERAVVIDGLVADATGSTLVLNVGSRVGVKVGDRLQVRRKIREVRDPATGKIIRSVESKIGDVVITDVDENSSVGNFEGTGTAKVGDVVKNL